MSKKMVLRAGKASRRPAYRHLLRIDPGVVKEGQSLDKADMYRNNYEATKLAIKRALNDEPGIDELIRNHHTIKHCLWDESWEK